MNPISKTIAITLGDPCGIGPEVTARAIACPVIRRLATFVVIGDMRTFLERGGRRYASCRFVDIPYPGRLRAGRVNKRAGGNALAALETAVGLLKEKRVSALVTAPLCKEAVLMNTPGFVGHTEFLARAFGCPEVGMMFVGESLRTMLVTRHIPLHRVSAAISPETVSRTILLTHQALKNLFQVRRPVIAVCGLNPHAGEHGHLGLEERDVIEPVIRALRKKRIDVRGPFAADTLFTPERVRTYDAVVAMYHDQGLIPVKSTQKKLVNLTVGLPFIRTSPAHGTAFDIAGQDRADAASMRAAIELAARLTP